MSSYYLEKLESEFRRRQKKNASYSLRAFAKFLDIDSSTLAAVFKKKRKLPFKAAPQIAMKLSLSPEEQENFVSSIYFSRSTLRNIGKLQSFSHTKILNDEIHHRIIAEWEHYAVYALLETKNARADHNWIAKRLGIIPQRAEQVLSRLVYAGLVVIDIDGKHSCQIGRLNTSEDVLSLSLKTSHLETLEMAARKLEEIPIDIRDFSSETFAIDVEKIEQAKVLIREFREKMSAFLSQGKTQEVYQLAIQFFPLTVLNSQKSEEAAKKIKGKYI